MKRKTVFIEVKKKSEKNSKLELQITMGFLKYTVNILIHRLSNMEANCIDNIKKIASCLELFSLDIDSTLNYNNYPVFQFIINMLVTVRKRNHCLSMKSTDISCNCTVKEIICGS